MEQASIDNFQEQEEEQEEEQEKEQESTTGGNNPPTETSLEHKITDEVGQNKHKFVKTDITHPTKDINEIQKSNFSLDLTTKSDTNNVQYTLIAGEGGVGFSDIDNPDRVKGVLDYFTDTPVLLTGGGSLLGGANYTFGILDNVERTENSVSLDVYFVYGDSTTPDRPLKSKENIRLKSRTLGSHQVSVPATPSDLVKNIRCISDWCNDKTEYLFSAKRRQKNSIEDRKKTFKNISVGDKINTPAYNTRLEVISEMFTTYATKSRKGLKDTKTKVRSITVDNPNGGYYQLGMEENSSQLDMPTCYLSGSRNNPPKPNTSFRRSNRFSLSEIEVTKIPHPTTETVISPDVEVLNSPLREPSMQASVDDIQYVGDKTRRKLIDICGPRVSADKMAHDLYNNGDTYTEEEVKEIEETLSNLPHSDKVETQLRDIAADIQSNNN